MSAAEYSLVVRAPFCALTLRADAHALVSVKFGAPPAGETTEPGPVLILAAKQLREYFEGSRRRFDLPLNPAGSEFQLDVWKKLLAIPYGETESYGAVAGALGRPKAARAVGGAAHRNPLAVVIPCHRVVGADGSLTGFAGGLAVKRELLELERRNKI